MVERADAGRTGRSRSSQWRKERLALRPAKNGVDHPADVLSGGTLRFAAIAAAFFQPSLPRTLILEEIEDGLHPTRLRLLVEL